MLYSLANKENEMGRPTPVVGVTQKLNEQQRALREYQRALTEERNGRARLVNLIARVLDDYKNHACVTDKTLRLMTRVHSEEVEK